jgi:hypothetical protein
MDGGQALRPPLFSLGEITVFIPFGGICASVPVQLLSKALEIFASQALLLAYECRPSWLV